MIASAIIADDSPVCRKLTRECLESLGLPATACREAGNGREALGLLRHWPAELLVTDLDMPVMDGFELLQAIQTLGGHRQMLRIVVSSTASVSLEGALRVFGAGALVPKPPSQSALLRAILTCRGGRHGR
jgi:CheY-like chemotaxis protein